MVAALTPAQHVHHVVGIDAVSPGPCGHHTGSAHHSGSPELPGTYSGRCISASTLGGTYARKKKKKK